MDEPNYGDISVWQKIQLIQEWAPLIKYGQDFLIEHDSYKKTVIANDCLEWLASKSKTKLDDELISKIDAILKTKEGEDFVRWVVSKIEGTT
jgi:hypothetical protein